MLVYKKPPIFRQIMQKETSDFSVGQFKNKGSVEILFKLRIVNILKKKKLFSYDIFRVFPVSSLHSRSMKKFR